MNVLFVGLSGVPRCSRACDIRLSFFANILSQKNKVTILNRYSSNKQLKILKTHLSSDVKVKEIILPKDTGNIFTFFLFVISIICEPFCILKFNKIKKIDVIHVYSGHYLDFVFYHLISRIIGAKVIYQYVEYRKAFKPRGLYHKINSFLCDTYGMKLFDGVLPISVFLENKTKEMNPFIPTLKIPPICDFSLFDNNNIKVQRNRPYLLFCASIGFLELIEFVVESHYSSLISKEYDLVLILSGDNNKIERLKERFPFCDIKTQLPYNDLITYFKNAYALYIPLRPILSDIARFPNKVCEYIASGSVIITTDVGEMSYYFKDGINAIVADNFSHSSMINCLDKLYRKEYNYDMICKSSYELGIKHFNMNSYYENLDSFLKTIINKIS